jgi:hypothetical protein
MRVIELDASSWTTPLDFLRALRAAIGAPEEHGWSPDAFVDSMIWGGMNCIEPPYMVKVIKTQGIPGDVTSYITLIASVIKAGRESRCSRHGTDVEVSLVAPELSNEDATERRAVLNDVISSPPKAASRP